MHQNKEVKKTTMDKAHMDSIRGASHESRKLYNRLDEDAKQEFVKARLLRKALRAKERYYQNRATILARRKELRKRETDAAPLRHPLEPTT